MSYDSTVLSDSPALFLKLDETSGTTAADASGNARDFSAGNVTWNQGSLLADSSGTSATFNGTSAYLRAADAAWMKSASVTVTLRYKHVTATGLRALVGRWQQAGQYAWLFYVNANKLEAQVNGGAQTVTGATTLTNGQTYTIAFRSDGTNIQVFLNGTSDGTLASAGPSASVASTFDVGEAAGGSGTAPSAATWAPGQVSRIAFWATALSDTRLAAQHSAAVATPSAAGTASLSLSASGGAKAPAGGSASLTLSATGATDGTTPASGTASLSLSATGAAAGASAASGTATLTLSATGSAVMSSGGTAYLTLSGGGTALALYETDTSNALDGLDVLPTMSVTFAVPIAAASSSLAVRQDKAIAYPKPTMVGGRPL